MKAIPVVGLVACLALAGCSGGGGEAGPSAGSGTTGPLASGKGAINGLLINDVFRPVPGGLVLIQELGLTATSDASGQFSFVDLEPGAYLLRVQADGHEAAPQSVDVDEGQYAEAEIMARRIFSESGRVITQEYSLFMTCTVDLVVVSGNGLNCLQDQSGESERTSFDTNLTATPGVTAMVTEIVFNKAGSYNFLVAIDDDGDDILDRYWAELDIDDGTYGRIVLKANETNTEAATGDRNEVWLPLEDPFTTTAFVHGLLYREIHDNTEVPGVTGGAFGVGVGLGIRAKIVQTVFIGEPDVDLATYCVLC